MPAERGGRVAVLYLRGVDLGSQIELAASEMELPSQEMNCNAVLSFLGARFLWELWRTTEDRFVVCFSSPSAEPHYDAVGAVRLRFTCHARYRIALAIRACNSLQLSRASLSHP